MKLSKLDEIIKESDETHSQRAGPPCLPPERMPRCDVTLRRPSKTSLWLKFIMIFHAQIWALDAKVAADRKGCVLVHKGAVLGGGEGRKTEGEREGAEEGGEGATFVRRSMLCY